MITFAQPMPIGNAVRVGLAPPAGSMLSRVLRNTSGQFAGVDDPAATLAYQGEDTGFVDFCGLTNGTAYTYAEFNFIDGDWVAGDTAQVTPNPSGCGEIVDALAIVRDRLSAGLAVEVGAGRLQPASGAIAVLTAPPLFEGTKWPVVTVHLKNDSPSVRGLGDDIGFDAIDALTGLGEEGSGWWSDVSLDIYGWVVGNPDVRIALRQAIKRIILGNLPIFEAAGLQQVSITQSDIEDMESYSAPVYQVVTSFSCLAPSAVSAPAPAALTDATITVLEAD